MGIPPYHSSHVSIPRNLFHRAQLFSFAKPGGSVAPCPFPLSTTAFHHFLPRFLLSDTRTELVQTEEEDGLVDLEAQNLGLDKAQGLAVDLDKALALLAVCDSSGGLLLAEALDRLNGRHFVRMCDEEVSRKVVRAGVVGRLVVVRFEMRFPSFARISARVALRFRGRHAWRPGG
jgi:hypothetical protein